MNIQTTKTMPTPEQLEYDELTMKIRFATAKLRISQEGVDVSSISQQNIDNIMRIFDDTEHFQRDTQQKISNIQQSASIQIQMINKDADKKFGDIQKRYQDLIKSLKEGHPQEIQEEQVQDAVTQPIVEEIREKAHEDKVSEITDIVLRAMKDTIYKRVDEIMKTADTRVEVTIERGIDAEVVEELADHTKQMTVESAITDTEERPDGKDIPIVSGTVKKTEEDN